MRKILLVVGGMVILGGCVILASQYKTVFTSESLTGTTENIIQEKENNETLSNVSEVIVPHSVKILFVGDLMLDRGVKYYVEKEGAGDYRFPFEKIHDYLASFDAVIPNLEGPISNKGVRVGSIYSFRMDPKVLDVFSYANIIAVNLANNHAWDYGYEAFFDTVTRLDEKGIGYFGGGRSEAEAYAPYVFEKNDIRIGILGFTEFSEYAQAKDDIAGITFADVEKIKIAIENAKKDDFDAFVVVFHFGEEYIPEPIERQKTLAHLAIDEGADLVVGHHPHIIESSETYNGKQIFYSLGNFIFDQNFSEETMTPGFLEVTISKKGIDSAILRSGSMTKFYEALPPDEKELIQ